MDFRDRARAALTVARRGEPRQGASAADNAARDAADAHDLSAQAYCLAVLAHCLYLSTEYARAERAGRQAVSTAQATRDRSCEALARAILSLVINRYNVGEAASHALLAERMAEQSSDRFVHHTVLLALSDLFVRVGALDEALAVSREQLALSRELADPVLLATASAGCAVDAAAVAFEAVKSGSARADILLAEADAALTEALMVTADAGSGYAHAYTREYAAMLREVRGDWSGALTLATELIDFAKKISSPNIAGRAAALKSRALLKLGRASEASDSASVALSIGIAADHRQVKILALTAMADASEHQGDYEGSARALRRVVELSAATEQAPRDLLMQMRELMSDQERVRSELTHRRSEVHQLREAATELARRTEALIEAGQRDNVTRLASRARADEVLPQLMDAAQFAHQPLAVAIIDIDRLKAINDSFGPTVGDRVLQRIADLSRAQLRESDVAARYGGDELVLLLPRVGGKDQAQHVAERVISAVVRADWRDLSAELKVAVNVGVALLSSQDTPETFRARAEQALIASRKIGKNAVGFAPAVDL